MPSKSQILVTTASVTAILLGGLTISAQAFTPNSGSDSRTAVASHNPVGGAAAPIRRVAMQRMPITASRTARKSAAAEPAVSDLAAKATAPLTVIISLDRQQLTLYSGDHPIAHSRVSTGMRGRGTPTGVFGVIQKDRWHRSNLYDDAPMWFMQRITWSGVAMHQGYVPNYPASHGCIRLPEAFARQMWTTTKIGARVIITRGETTPAAIMHPNLFMPKHTPPAPAITQAQALKAAEQAWTFAELASKTPLVGATMTDFPTPGTLPAELPKPARVLKPGPVSVFVSRKEGRLYVRKGFEPLFDMPIAIEQPKDPIGTHVFTAIAVDDETTARWTVVTAAHAAGTTAQQALDRITIPQDARDQISELITPGASLIISDQGLGSETGKGTDFIVLTRQ